MFHVSVFWLIVGAFIGFDVAMAYGWLSLRRVNRGRELVLRINEYVDRDALVAAVRRDLHKRHRRNPTRRPS